MSTIRKAKESKGFAMSRALAQDNDLTFQARGLMSYLLSKPTDWKAQLRDIERAGNISRDIRIKLVAELESAGYLERVEIRNKGQIGYELLVHEEPLPERKRTSLTRRKSSNDSPHTAEPCTENPDTVEPDTVKPDAYIYKEVLEIQDKEKQEPAAPPGTAANGKPIPQTSDHARLMQHLAARCGQFPDGPAQGKACKWILTHDYSAEEAIACFDHLMGENWRTGRISWLIVQKEIGVWKLKYGLRWEINRLQVELSALKGCSVCGDLPGYLDRNREKVCTCNPMHEMHARHGDYERFVNLTLEEKAGGKPSGQVQPSDRTQAGVSQYPAAAH